MTCFRNLVREPMPNFEDNDCTAETDAEGRVGPAILRAFTERQTEGGGPSMWVNFKYRCPNCASDLYSETSCCTQIPEGYQCKPDADTYEDDPDVNINSYLLLILSLLSIFSAIWWV